MSQAADQFRDMLATHICDNSAFLDDACTLAKPLIRRAGEDIVSRQSRDNTVFILTEGMARALIYSEDGHEIWLGDFEPGDMLGEMAALQGLSRSADITAVTDTRMMSLSAAAFMKMMDDHSAFGLAVSRILARRIRTTTQRMYEMSALSAQARIYAQLKRLSRPIDPADPTRRQIKPAPILTEFAKWVNSTRETVSRTISQLEKRGKVERQPDALIVIAPDHDDVAY